MAISLKDVPSNIAFRIPYHPSVTEKNMRRAAELLVDHERRAAESHSQNVKAFVSAVESKRKKLISLLGTENHFALEQFKEELRLEAFNQLRPPHGLEGSRAEFVRNRTRRVSSFLSKRGIKPEVVRDVVAHLFEGVTLKSDVKITGSFQLDTIAQPPDENPWQTFAPPYTGDFAGYQEGANGYRINRMSLADTIAGQVGLQVTLDDTNSGEIDYGFVNAGSVIAIWFHAPIAGLVEVVIDAQCGEARHELRVKNQWGFSDCETTQRHYLMAQVMNPNIRQPSYSLASEFTHSGDDDESFDEHHLIAGQNVRARLISDGAMRAGEDSLIKVGCWTEDHSNANDMEVHSRSTFVWFLKRVHVRILE